MSDNRSEAGKALSELSTVSPSDREEWNRVMPLKADWSKVKADRFCNDMLIIGGDGGMNEIDIYTLYSKWEGGGYCMSPRRFRVEMQRKGIWIFEGDTRIYLYVKPKRTVV